MSETACPFCMIVAGEIAADIVYSDDEVVAIRDINPQAPVHLLILPRRHVPNITSAAHTNQPLLSRVMMTAVKLSESEGVDRAGYRFVINTGVDGGQTVDHLHVHLLGGRAMGWPPG